MSNKDFKKIFFPLQVDEYGYPPVSIESLNAKEVGQNMFRIDNTPFFIEEIALGDVIVGNLIPDSNNHYWYTETYSESNNKSLSIIFLEEGHGDELIEFLKMKNCYCEYGSFNNSEMLAVSVPKDSDYEEIFSYLSNLEKEEVISFAELAV